jgi:hypothetical protein
LGAHLSLKGGQLGVDCTNQRGVTREGPRLDGSQPANIVKEIVGG